jgi:succinate dehydrogenase / fumarate reductase flavoprotein subunit
MYNQEMQNSMKLLEETRSERMLEKLPLLSSEEKEELLSKFHPDYKPNTTREMKVGANKGDNVYLEYADLFESYSSLDPEKFKLGDPDFDVDVLIIGGGGAGAAAALTAESMGANVLLTTKLRLGDANTMMAQGGIQAADKANDSPDKHYLDVVGGGGFHNDAELVQALVTDAPSVIHWLEKLGVMFDKEKDGTMITIHGGGTSRKRMHSARDYSGGEIMKTLRDEVLNRNIDVIEFSPAIELLTEKDRVTGAVLYNLETEEYIIVSAKTTILATGGSGRLHIQGFPTTNHYGATADGLVLAYRAGASMAFMDTVQYHPTGAAFPEQIVGLLITEKMRSLGAQLVNKKGKRFIYELETRDAEAAAIIRECQERGMGVTTPSGMQGVWLDSPLVEKIHGEGILKKRVPAMYRQFMRFDIDIAEVPILVYPTQHYQNGGIKINNKSETQVKNLFAAGETTGGVHGRNRLMGNSLLDILVFGIRSGENAAKKAKDTKFGKLTLNHIEKYHDELRKAKIKEDKSSPLVLPDYRREKTKARHVGIFEGGLA